MTTISIITPCYNNVKYIEQTIQSVCKQRGDFNIEYIMMDGGSTDGTLEIIKKAEKDFNHGIYPQLKSFLWVSKKDNGQSDAINQGLRMATGDIVAFINGDDYYELDTFKKVLNFFKDKPNEHFVTGKCNIVNENNQRIHTPIAKYKNFWLKFNLSKILLVLNPISQPATFWKRNLHDELGYFKEDENLVMDYEFWLRISEKYSLPTVSQSLANFRIHKKSKGSESFNQQFEDELRVAKSYIKNKLQNILYYLHFLHKEIIILTYRIIK